MESRKRETLCQFKSGKASGVQVENSGAPGISRRSNAEEMDFHRFPLKNN